MSVTPNHVVDTWIAELYDDDLDTERQVLVTQYGDGTYTVTWRPDPWSTWRPWSNMRPAP